MSEPLRCNCEPTVHPDGSVGHEDDCRIKPWCPHEMGFYVCDMPCGCGCRGCSALSEGHAAFNASREVDGD